MTKANKIHPGHILLALSKRFDWFVNRMMTEFEVDGGLADVVFITRARQLTEIEIKVSRADWNVDAKKMKWRRDRPHVSRFYYAVPGHLAENIPSWVPLTAGIIAVYLNDYGMPYSREIRPAKRKRATPIPQSRINDLHESAYYRFWRWQTNFLRERYWREPQKLQIAA